MLTWSKVLANPERYVVLKPILTGISPVWVPNMDKLSGKTVKELGFYADPRNPRWISAKICRLGFINGYHDYSYHINWVHPVSAGLPDKIKEKALKFLNINMI